MASKLGSGSGIFSALGQYHEESGPHGGVADIVANARDAGAQTWRLQGTRVSGTEVVAFSDDGPGPQPANRPQGSSAVPPTADTLLRMVRPGSSSSTNDASKIGQAGVGTLTGSLVLGASVLFATHDNDELFVLLVSEPFNEKRRADGIGDAEVIQVSCDKTAPHICELRGLDHCQIHA